MRKALKRDLFLKKNLFNEIRKQARARVHTHSGKGLKRGRNADTAPRFSQIHVSLTDGHVSLSEPIL